ncbi:ArsR/SmtB family transcription factor [Cryptosporangium sp. NPDC048952]|uniref:ArsR/SmtB family transcription factor n=1 Tax=Cryptosporangium sp. NPDC048952 TaxID=3363961 RepID=UPI003714A157
MIHIRLSRSAVASTRIAISPLAELTAAVELVYRYGSGQAPWPYTLWADQAHAVLRSMPRNAPLGVYGRLSTMRGRQRTPDVFHPVATSPSTTSGLQDELELLRRTPSSTVNAQVATHCPDGAPRWLAIYQRNPEKAFSALSDSLFTFWQRAVQPFWPRMRVALEEEVLSRARAIATGGPESILGELGGVAGWKSPVLTLPKARDSWTTASRRRLVLVPVLFADHQAMCSTDDPTVLRVTYQSRGAAVLASGAAPFRASDTDRLGRLLGRRRAQVLRGLSNPTTTLGLAALLGLPTSTVSEHLAALHEAGAVHRRRAGRQVYYGLERAGHELLASFDAVDEDPAAPDRFSGERRGPNVSADQPTRGRRATAP